MDRYDLYELAVTDPPRLARFLDAVHGHNPRVLREDFSGSAALARHWAARSPRHAAIAVDRDREPLARIAATPRLTPRRSDVLRARDHADIVACTNFPLGYWHTRPALLKYLRHARTCLRPRGLFIADTYGGHDAFTPSKTTTRLRAPLPDSRRAEHADSSGPSDRARRTGVRVDYAWEQREADPVTARVLNAMHFRIQEPGRQRPRIVRDAFVYDWRLWSIPELTDALTETGFRKVEVYHRMGEAIDLDGRLLVRPTQPGDDLGPSWVVYVVGRR